MSKKRVKNRTLPKPNIKPQYDKGNVFTKNIFIDFTKYPRWIYSINGKKFVNSLKDEAEAAYKFYFLLHHLFPEIESMGPNVFRARDHCHPIKGEQLALSKKIIQEIDGFTLGEDTSLWQLSAKGSRGIRIVGSFVTEKIYIFYPLFVDYYHQLYPSPKYNQRDLKKNKFKPQAKYD